MNKIVDNFELLASYLFDDRPPLTEDQFYFLQILVRGKDGNHVDGNNKNRLVKYYIIRHKQQLLDLKEEIVGICHLFNGRAYIHPTRRSFKEVANLVLELTAHTFVSQNWVGLRSTYSTACGKSFVGKDKQYIVDCDELNIGEVIKISIHIDKLRGRKDQNGKIFQIIIPTKNGYHIIANAFDIDEFKKTYNNIDIHTNNPTLLYYKSIE